MEEHPHAWTLAALLSEILTEAVGGGPEARPEATPAACTGSAGPTGPTVGRGPGDSEPGGRATARGP